MEKCLVVITGDNFRLGGQRSPERGGDESYRRQLVATNSHLRLFKHLNNVFNIKVDVVINSYKLNDEYDNQFIDWYKDYTIFQNFFNERLRDEHSLIYDTINRLRNLDLYYYKFVLFIRPDCYLKKYFLEVFNPNEDKVLYAHLDSAYGFSSWNPPNSGFSSHDVPAVNHIITYCPNSEFDNLLNNRVWHWHDSAVILSKFVDRSKIGFIIPTFHSCCSSLDWNPIYSLVGRGECLEYKDPDYVYNFENNEISNIDTISSYSHLMYIDTIEENLKSL